MNQAQIDHRHMLRACEVALQAQGHAEPNPTVGCVIAVADKVLAEGWTQPFGSDHAEIHALRQISAEAQQQLSKATLYVTLEPCCHQGKTAPCTEAILNSAIRRVVIAVEDPFSEVAGQGIRQLRSAGLEVQLGVARSEAEGVLSPYLKLLRSGRPWVLAKWAMTLDGKIATKTGESRWISSPDSRATVHWLRGRMDAIMIGMGTALADDPLLTARPPGPRVATRIVLDSHAGLPLDSQLLATAEETPLLVAVGPTATKQAIQHLQQRGAEVLQCGAATREARLDQLLCELGSRQLTNVLVEGGATLLGCLLDTANIDEVHCFVAPKLVGGQALGPVSGQGIASIADALRLHGIRYRHLGEDMYVTGRVT